MSWPDQVQKVKESIQKYYEIANITSRYLAYQIIEDSIKVRAEISFRHELK